MPRTVLILSSMPRDMAPLRVHEEAREIEDAIRRARDRDEFRVVTSLGTRARDVHGVLLRHRPAIVHFSGHGRGAQGVILEDDAGDSLPVSGADLARMLGHFRGAIECVLINSWRSEAQIDKIAEHIPFVIGMNQAPEDRAAISFATAFHEALANGETIPVAYAQGLVEALLFLRRLVPDRTDELARRAVDVLDRAAVDEPTAVFLAWLSGDASDAAGRARLCTIYRALPPGEIAVPYVSHRLGCPGGERDDSPACQVHRLLSAPKLAAVGGDLEQSVCATATRAMSRESGRKDRFEMPGSGRGVAPGATGDATQQGARTSLLLVQLRSRRHGRAAAVATRPGTSGNDTARPAWLRLRRGRGQPGTEMGHARARVGSPGRASIASPIRGPQAAAGRGRGAVREPPVCLSVRQTR
jgi:hypothetical protein